MSELTPYQIKTAKAIKTMTSLLKSPKTKRGLAAAIKEFGLTAHFVYGWLSTEMKAGRVTPVHVHDGDEDLFILARTPVEPKVKPSIYPAWLEPRTLPQASQRRYCGLTGISTEEQEESEPANEKVSSTDRRPKRRTQRRPAGGKRP